MSRRWLYLPTVTTMTLAKMAASCSWLGQPTIPWRARLLETIFFKAMMLHFNELWCILKLDKFKPAPPMCTQPSAQTTRWQRRSECPTCWEQCENFREKQSSIEPDWSKQDEFSFPICQVELHLPLDCWHCRLHPADRLCDHPLKEIIVERTARELCFDGNWKHHNQFTVSVLRTCTAAGSAQDCPARRPLFA